MADRRDYNYVYPPNSLVNPGIGLLVAQNSDPTRSPVPLSVPRRKATGKAKSKDDQPAQSASASAYTPDGVLKSQNDLAGYFQSLPTAQVVGGGGLASAAGWAGNIGKGFMSTYLPTKAEEKMRENERITAAADKAILGAGTLADMGTAAAGGSPDQRAWARQVRATQMQREADHNNPNEIARTRLAEEELNIKKQDAQLRATQAAAAARREAEEAALFGSGVPQVAGAPTTQPPMAQTVPNPFSAGDAVPYAPPAPTNPDMPAIMQPPMPQPQSMGPAPGAPPMTQGQQSVPASDAGAVSAPPPAPNTDTQRDILMRMPAAERGSMGVLYRTKPEEYARIMREKANPEGVRQAEFDKEYAKKAPEYFTKSYADFAAASSAHRLATDMELLVPHIYSGTFAGARTETAKFLNTHVGMNFKGVAPTETFRSLSQKFVGEEGQKYKPLSNSDIAFIEKGLPNIDKDPSSIPHILGAMKAASARETYAKNLEMQALRRGSPPDMAAIKAQVDAKIPSYIETAIANGTLRGEDPAARPSGMGVNRRNPVAPAQAAPPQPAASAPRRVTNPTTKEVLEERDGAWVRVQ